MKKTLLTMAVALLMGLGATAQNTMFDRIDTDDYIDTDSYVMFDWNAFTDLFDWVGELDGLTSSGKLFEGFGDRSGDFSLSLPGAHGGTDDIDAPLGSGIVLLAGLGAAYAFAKRRKEE